MQYEFCSEFRYYLSKSKLSISLDDGAAIANFLHGLDIEPSKFERIESKSCMYSYKVELDNSNYLILGWVGSNADGQLVLFNGITLYINNECYHLDAFKQIANEKNDLMYDSCYAEYYDKTALNYVLENDSTIEVDPYPEFRKYGICPDSKSRFNFCRATVQEKRAVPVVIIISELKRLARIQAKDKPQLYTDNNVRINTTFMVKKVLDEMEKPYQRPEPDPNIKTSFEDESNLRKVL